MKRFLTFVFLSLIIPKITFAQNDSLPKKEPQKVVSKWYENVNIRGYVQARYNGLLETNPDLGCEQCDKSWGGDGGFFLRRVRIIFFGQINPRVYFYIQPDFASSASSTGLHFGQLRDAYFDLSIDKLLVISGTKKERLDDDYIKLKSIELQLIKTR